MLSSNLEQKGVSSQSAVVVRREEQISRNNNNNTGITGITGIRRGQRSGYSEIEPRVHMDEPYKREEEYLERLLEDDEQRDSPQRDTVSGSGSAQRDIVGNMNMNIIDSGSGRGKGLGVTDMDIIAMHKKAASDFPSMDSGGKVGAVEQIMGLFKL